MKKVLHVFTTILLLISYSCEKKIDLEKEKAAVMAVIEEETAAYYASDFDRWSATYVQDSTMLSSSSSAYWFDLFRGWDAGSANAKPYITGKKDPGKEIKTPVMIKVYGETAWVVFDNEAYNQDGNLVARMLVTNFLEKKNGLWKIAYRSYVQTSDYYQSNMYLVSSISYAKSAGKSVEEFGGYTGDLYKTMWNQAGGYSAFANGAFYNWSSWVPGENLVVVERDDNHLKFSVTNPFPDLKNNGPRFNVTHEDYMTFTRVLFEKIADHLGATYSQEVTEKGVIVTTAKK